MKDTVSATEDYRFSPAARPVFILCMIAAAAAITANWREHEAVRTAVEALTAVFGLVVACGSVLRRRQTKDSLVLFVGLSFFVPALMDMLRLTASFHGLADLFGGADLFSWTASRFLFGVLLTAALLQAGALRRARRWRVAVLSWAALVLGALGLTAILFFLVRSPAFDAVRVSPVPRPWELPGILFFVGPLFLIRRSLHGGAAPGSAASVLSACLKLSALTQLAAAFSVAPGDDFDKIAHVLRAFALAVPAFVLWSQIRRGLPAPAEEREPTPLRMIRPETVAAAAFFTLAVLSVATAAAWSIGGGFAGAADVIPEAVPAAVLSVMTLSLLGLGAVLFRLLRAADLTHEEMRLLNLSLERRIVERTADLRRKAEELERINRELDEFTYAASHDLQEPLRKIIGFGDLLREELGKKLDAEAARHLDVMRDGARRLQNLIRELLALSRTGRAALRFSAVPLDRCVDEALRDLHERLEETKAKIERESLPTVRCDPTQIRLLYFNLIGNALKYSGDRPPHVVLTCAEKDGETVFGVYDKGIGIAPKDRERVFAPFQRLHSAAEYEGSGIGLALCKKIVERHRGRIWVEPSPEGGAFFRFTLRVPEGKEGEEEKGEAESFTGSAS